LDLIKGQTDLESLELEWDWLTLKEYLARLKEQGIALNVVPLIGHGTIRAAVMGFDDRAPTEAELTAMKGLIVQAMQEGARGVTWPGSMFQSWIQCIPQAIAQEVKPHDR
ncbi:hypothetical protein M1N21_03310, partial [Dehalococcoidia bacterium]|nr:hypothetical protein [Dehalococcoidia bacterium]